MDSVELVLALVAEGVGVVKEIADLARRVNDGLPVTKEELMAAREAAHKAVARWDAAMDKDKI